MGSAGSTFPKIYSGWQYVTAQATKIVYLKFGANRQWVGTAAAKVQTFVKLAVFWQLIVPGTQGTPFHLLFYTLPLPPFPFLPFLSPFISFHSPFLSSPFSFLPPFCFPFPPFPLPFLPPFPFQPSPFIPFHSIPSPYLPSPIPFPPLPFLSLPPLQSQKLKI